MVRQQRAGRAAASGGSRAQTPPGRAPRPAGAQRPVAEAPAPESGGRGTRVGLAVGALLAGGLVLYVLSDRAGGQGAKAGPSATVLPGAAPLAPAPAGRPALTRLEITPQVPTRSDVVIAAVEATDPDGDPVSFEYRWVINEREADATGPTLPLSGFEPGTRVAVRVVPFDAGGAGAGLESAPVVVANRAPAITRLGVTPDPPEPGQPITLDIEAADEEGDPVTFSVEWTVNDQPLFDVTGTTLDGSHVPSGARVVATVMPEDLYSSGETRSIGPILVGNRAPEFRSPPPDPAPGTRVRHQVVASDPDGDPVTYHLEQGPPGMRLDPRTGALEWDPVPMPGDGAPVSVRVEDGKGGRTVQRFTLRTLGPS